MESNSINFLSTKTIFHVRKWNIYDGHFWKIFVSTLNVGRKSVPNGEFYP